MKRYGVDPLNPKVVVIDGIPVPKEYAKRLGEELVRGWNCQEARVKLLTGDKHFSRIDGLEVVSY